MSHNISLLFCLVVCLASLAAPQLADFNDLFRLASLGGNSETRSDRSLTNSYPFNLGERQAHHHHQTHNPNAARQNIDTLGLQSETPAASFPLGRSGFSFSFGGGNGQFAQHLFSQARARQDSLPLHSSVQQHLPARQPPQQSPGYQTQQISGYQTQQSPGYQTQQSPGYQTQQPSGYQSQHHSAGQHQQHQTALLHQHQSAVLRQPAFIGPAPAPSGHSHSEGLAPSGYVEAPAVIPVSGQYEEAAPVITVAAVAPAAPAAPAGCPAPSILPHHCHGAVNSCWSVGVPDVDCPGQAVCCFDGCSNYCVGQAPPLAQPAVVVPEVRTDPAQGRHQVQLSLAGVAAAGKRCVDKVEQVEEIVYDDVEECHHSYDKKCHTTYQTEYESQQEEECDDNFHKTCEDCNLAGPEICKTEYISECWTRNDPHLVVDDVPKCRTEYEEKCEYTQDGYVTDQKCSKWPREVCTIAKERRSKANPVTKCEKVPQRLCGPAGCGFVPGPEQCHDKVKTVVTDIPNEVCDLQPQRKCSHVTKLVPKLTPVEECVDVPKEVCQKSKGNPRKVVKPVTKKWCYVPSEESGLV